MTIFLFDPPGCVFIRIRKTGSTSALNGLFGGKGNAKLKNTNGEWAPEFDGNFTFAFVRNPFARLVSCYRMFQIYCVKTLPEQRLRESLDLDRVMDIVEDESIPLDGGDYLSKLRLHAIPMTHPFYHLHRAHFIGRFENFGQDFLAIVRRLNIDTQQVPEFRRGKPYDYRRWYTPKLTQRAKVVFGNDIEAFGYDFDKE